MAYMFVQVSTRYTGTVKGTKERIRNNDDDNNNNNKEENDNKGG